MLLCVTQRNACGKWRKIGRHFRAPGKLFCSLRPHFQQMLKGLLPGRETMRNLVAIELIEGISVQANPVSVGIITLYNLPPDGNRKAVACFLRPGDLPDLQMVLLKRKISGISPSARAAKYLVPTTSKS